MDYELAEGLYRHSDKVRHYMMKISDKLHVIYIINNNYDLYKYKWNDIARNMENMYLSIYNYHKIDTDYYITEEQARGKYFTNISTDIKKPYEDLLVKVEYELKKSDDFFWRKHLKELFMEFKLDDN